MNDAVDRLKRRSSSPYSPEPPKKSLAVNLLMALARKFGQQPLKTPHLFGGNDLDKTSYEYENMEKLIRKFSLEVPFADLMKDRDVLDIGCGWGGKTIYFKEHMHPKSIAGFDLPGVLDTEVPAQFARNRGIAGCTFTTGYAESIPFEDASADFLLMEDVFEHVKSPTKVIAECLRVLRPGGWWFNKFPSFKMMCAHHLDRAVTLPAIHYLLPMKTWAAGLNYCLLNSATDLGYEPFDAVQPTQYHPAITSNLNGIDATAFHGLIEKSEFQIETLKIVPFCPVHPERLIARVYGLLNLLPPLREFLGHYVLFLGRKPELP